MLLRLGEVERLRDYVMGTRDSELLTWWARYCEATGDIGSALQVYEMAGNHVASVKLRCMAGELEAAEQIVENTMDPGERLVETTGPARILFRVGRVECAPLFPHHRPSALAAAAFQLAVQYESMDLLEEAIRFFVKANRPAYALRLAIKLSDDAQIAQLAARCPRSDQLAAARRMEAAGDLDRAVRLYQMGGNQVRWRDELAARSSGLLFKALY